MHRASVFFSAVALTSALTAANGYNGKFDLYSGWRQDDFVWGIPGGTDFPNYATEINWKEMQSAIIGARVYLAGWDMIYVRAQADGGIILQGEPTKTVYANSDLSDIFSQTHAEKAGNKVFDIKGAIGFHILPNCGPVDLAVCAGFAYQGQNFRVTNPCLSTAPFPLSPFCIDDFSNHYHARWKSGFVGLDNYWNICDCWSIGIQGELHWAAFRGNSTWQWNKRGGCCSPTGEFISRGFREDFVDIKWKDSASGWGQVISGCINYAAWNGWGFGLMGGYQTFKTRPGQHCIEQFRENIPEDYETVVSVSDVDCALNRIHWRSFFISFNFECSF